MATSYSDSSNSKNQDALTATLNRMGSRAAKNSKAVALGAVGFLAVAGAVTFFTSKRENRAEDAKNALYLAEKSQETELKTIAETLKPVQAKPKTPPAAKPGAKAQTQPENPPADPSAVAFMRFDVDARLPETVKKYQEVIKEYDGTRAAFEARLALASLYMDHGDAAKAAPWLEQAVSKAPNSTERAYALSALGYAHENSGKPNEAYASFDKALGQGVESIKGDLLLGMARTAGDAGKARALYDRIISEHPDTEYARAAEQLKSRI